MKRDLNALSNREYDLLIIGGGIYGVTIAWDAVLRGLSVALIERSDFGGGTSANSLKIIHGGLRYLQTLDVERMRQSIRERRILMGIAPHLVHPLHCVMPTYGYLMKGKAVMSAGLLLNDMISYDRNRLGDPEKTIPKCRMVSRAECLKLIPGLDGKGVTGGAMWTDAQMVNSERLTLSFMLSAAQEGCTAANYVEAREFLKRNEDIHGVKAVDVLSGDELEIQAKCVVNATGGWVDHVLKGILPHSQRIQPSTAMNLIVRRRLLKSCAAGVMGKFQNTLSDGSVYRGRRVLFMAPWRDYTIIGTFHRPYDGDVVGHGMKVGEDEIQSFLKEINSAVPESPLSRGDVAFFHKGFLPMDGIHAKTGEVKLTKHYQIHDHQKKDGLGGLVSVVGVKYTTARDVAEKTVNLIFSKLSRKSPKCTSDQMRLWGGNIERFDDFLTEALGRPTKTINESVMHRLVYHYGSQHPRILAMGEEDPGTLKTISDSGGILVAEILQSVREEMALKLADVVFRRTDLGSGGHPGDACLTAIATIMSQELGWDNARVKQELEEVNQVYQPAGPKRDS